LAKTYDSPHDRAIKAANWAMRLDPACKEAHRRRLSQDLAIANGHEVQKARAAHEAAKAECGLTMAVFDRVMAEAGFPQSNASLAAE
jgi:hypothetical protein